MEYRLRGIKGVESVQANPITGNVLIHFDCRTTDKDVLLAELGRALEELLHSECPESVNGRSSPLRIIARGLLGHAVVDSLWFGGGFLGSAMGLPLAGLGSLHILMDLAVWTMAFTGEPTRR